jgi:hypothetical protein
MSVFLVGYVIFMVGVFLALWKWGVLEDLGTAWSSILGLLALGFGVMIAVTNSGRKENIEIDSK